MDIGKRIHLARSFAGLSLRALGNKVGVSQTAINKYEKNFNVPSSDVLLKISDALNVKVDYFYRTLTIELSDPSYMCKYRCKARPPHKKEKKVLAEVRDFIERYREIELLTSNIPAFDKKSTTIKISCLEDIEDVSEKIRTNWELGFDPITNLVEILEERGILVGLVCGIEEVDSLITYINDEIPVIVVKRNLPGDRQRFSLAHELGHIVIDHDESLQEHEVAHRFAESFLVPRERVFMELGHKRKKLDFEELYLLKHKYGLSIQGWIYRALHLRIISKSCFNDNIKHLKTNGWDKKEPGEQFPSEEPKRMERLVRKALSENIISQSKASEILNKSLLELRHEFA